MVRDAIMCNAPSLGSMVRVFGSQKINKPKFPEKKKDWKLKDYDRYDKYVKACNLKGSQIMEAHIMLWLVTLNHTLNLNKPLQQGVMQEVAKYIVNDYNNLNIADINIIFKNAKTGLYGEFYESLNMPKILGWFRDYHETRMDIAEEMNFSNHSTLKGRNETPIDLNRVFNSTSINMSGSLGRIKAEQEKGREAVKEYNRSKKKKK